MRGLAAPLAFLAFACVSACRDAAPAGPPEIRLGVDVCDGCGMTIAEDRYAAGALADGNDGRRVLKFDDIGCLARWEAAAPGGTVRGRWVHDRTTEVWIDAGAAVFSQSRELTTPMGSGIVAFRNASEADALVAERGGETLSWESILARARDGSLQRHPGSGKEATR